MTQMLIILIHKFMRKMLSSRLFSSFRIASNFSEISKFQNNFLNTTNLAYIQSLYQKWHQDKNSVSKSFAAYFELLESGVDPQNAFEVPSGSEKSLESSTNIEEIKQQLKMRLMIDRHRRQGHYFAKVDPLELESNKDLHGRPNLKILEAPSFGYKKEDMQKQIMLKNVREDTDQYKEHGPYTIQSMEDYLQQVYCDKIGYQYMHILDKNQRDFIKNYVEKDIEGLKALEPTPEERIQTFHRLAKDQIFIDFLGNKFGNFKRFGIEGLNASASALGELVEVSAKNGAENIVFGMAHRGRLNTLHCVFGKPAQALFREFLEKKNESSDSHDNASGDVKYHLGFNSKIKIGEKEVTLSMLPNPSHLQAVNPLVYGTVRALEEYKDDIHKTKVVGVLIHGDAAVSGQGVVYQSLEMQDLVDYTPGGIIHIVLNNQIGFTTPPKQSRSSYYCTEVAKVMDCPIIHVNGDEPDLLDRCMQIAVEYRYKFKKDIFIDIVGYRRHGHNEQDQPTFTQPLMYNKIKNKKNVFETYCEKLIQKNILSKGQIESVREKLMKEYEEDYKKVMSDQPFRLEEFNLDVSVIKTPKLWGEKTGVSKDVLTEIINKVTTWPSDFNIHPTIKKIYEERIKNFKNDQPLDWATMESLAFGTLLYENYGVRLSGQDVQRGTFSHRHALISDQQRDVEKFTFLKEINKKKVTVSNSHLSEYGVMGFQYGYSITNPNTLTIWEAQFGDFANGAAIIIDNFLVSGETKWDQQSGLVLNLPHGMDGQGPQHSSGRVERFLHLSDDNCDVDQLSTYENQMKNGNIQVVTCSTASNYFHAMRRQIRRAYRKPLILFNSKKLLKFKGANRPISDILEGTEFQTVYPDESALNLSKIKQVLICNGQFYYELKSKRDELKRDDVAIVRIEQIAPFPHEALKKVLSIYGPETKYSWVQEEHQNYGCLNFVHPRLELLLKKKIGIKCRRASGSTAVGAMKLHKKEEEILLAEIFG